MNNCIKQMCCNQFGERDAMQGIIDELNKKVNLLESEIRLKDSLIADIRTAKVLSEQHNDNLVEAIETYKQQLDIYASENSKLRRDLGLPCVGRPSKDSKIKHCNE